MQDLTSDVAGTAVEKAQTAAQKLSQPLGANVPDERRYRLEPTESNNIIRYSYKETRCTD